MNTEKFRDHFYIAILCGGGGKRLWPRSRVKAPKQFIKLFGDKTIFQNTVARAKRLVPLSRIFLVTNFDYLDEIAQQTPEILRENIIAEPMAKNTAMAMGLGSAYIQRKDPEAVVTFFPSDHHVEDLEKFDQSILLAGQVAWENDYLVAVGVTPTFPHTGMGYIKRGRYFAQKDAHRIYKVERYTEKPDLATAQKFLKAGQYYWNANLYTWKVNLILEEMQEYLPTTAAGIKKIVEADKSEVKKTTEEVYKKVEDVMIDYAISEKTKRLLLVPTSFTWSDIGDWKVIYDVSPKDENGNVIIHEKGEGEFISLDTKNSLVHFSDQLIVTIGVENLVIIDTKDALLVANKDRVEEIKKLVNTLKEKGKLEYL